MHLFRTIFIVPPFSAPSSSTPVRDATPTNHVLEVEQGEKQEGVRLEGKLVEEEEEGEEGEEVKGVNAAENAEEEERTEKVGGLAAASSEC